VERRRRERWCPTACDEGSLRPTRLNIRLVERPLTRLHPVEESAKPADRAQRQRAGDKQRCRGGRPASASRADQGRRGRVAVGGLGRRVHVGMPEARKMLATTRHRAASQCSVPSPRRPSVSLAMGRPEIACGSPMACSFPPFRTRMVVLVRAGSTARLDSLLGADASCMHRRR
jgi:hypothetical protein